MCKMRIDILNNVNIFYIPITNYIYLKVSGEIFAYTKCVLGNGKSDLSKAKYI